MSFIDVKIKGTTDKAPPSGYLSWLDFWEKNRKIKATRCNVVWCGKRAEVGEHVIKTGKDDKEYILPMCNSCNKKSENDTFKAWEGDLVSVKQVK